MHPFCSIQCHLDREPISSCLFEEGLKLLMSLGLVILEHGGLRGTFKALLAIEFGDSIRLAVPALSLCFSKTQQGSQHGSSVLFHRSRASS